MRFQVSKKQQTPSVIIIALIDVLIVMLIFLMATTTFKQHPALKLALPESTQAKKSGSSEDTLLLISVDAQGELWLGADSQPMDVAQLRQALVAESQKNPQVKLGIRADKGAPVGQVVSVMDAAKEAKIKVATLFTKEIGEP